MKYLSNAFSPNMQGENICITRPVTRVEVAKAIIDVQLNKRPGDDEGEHTGIPRAVLVAESIVGHADVARLMGAALAVAVPTNRVSVQLAPGDVLWVGQYSGPRLPEGCTELPEGATIKWYRVDVTDVHPDDRYAEALKGGADAQRKTRERLQVAFGFGPFLNELGELMQHEQIVNCGWPDDAGRDALAAKIGITRPHFDERL